MNFKFSFFFGKKIRDSFGKELKKGTMNLSEHDKAVLETIFNPLQLASFDPNDIDEKNRPDDPNGIFFISKFYHQLINSIN